MTTEGALVDDRLLASQALARQRMLDQLSEQESAIKSLESQLKQRESEIAHLQDVEEINKGEEAMGAVAIRREQCEKDPRNIAAEDALDTIVRLENTLKIAQRRNALITKENNIAKKTLKDKTKFLQGVNEKHGELLTTTGFHEGSLTLDIDSLRAKIAEMEALEKTLVEESKTAKVILRKKQALVETLVEEVDEKKRREEELLALHNDIRVKDRDIQQVKAEIEKMTKEDRKTDGALVTAENRRDVVAITSLQGDNEFLQREITKQRETRRSQEEVIRMQIHRVISLEDRLQTVTNAVRELKLDQKMEKALGKTSAVVDAAGEPDDKARILPPEETVPGVLYELLVRDLESVRNSVSRKDIILLEKEATSNALQDKVEKASMKNQDEDRQHQLARKFQKVRMEEMQTELTDKLAQYRDEVDELLTGNLELRNKIERITAQRD